MLVVDASALVDLLAGTTRAAGVRERLLSADGLAAPELLAVETLSALHRLVRSRVLSEAEADAAAASMAAMPVRPIAHEWLLDHAWSLRHAVRVADAFYLACALRLSAPLLTSDARLARSGVAGVTITLVA